MDIGTGLQCPGCGSSDVTFDPRIRLLICNQCGNRETYQRATLNRNGKIVYCKENAIRCFSEGHYEEAKHFAMDIMNISIEDIAARYIVSFYNEIVLKDQGEIEGFFDSILNDNLDFDEIRKLMTLVKVSLAYLKNYEIKIIKTVAANMQAEADKKELCEFMDVICPYFIAQRNSIAFMSDEMAELYGDLAEHCTIPKTCFSLIKAIDTNRDSPYVGNTFELRAKTQYFYERYLIPVGRIIKRMVSDQWKQKFEAAYNQKLQDFKQRANLE